MCQVVRARVPPGRRMRRDSAGGERGKGERGRGARRRTRSVRVREGAAQGAAGRTREALGRVRIQLDAKVDERVVERLVAERDGLSRAAERGGESRVSGSGEE